MSPTITLATTTYTYDGTAKEPAVSSVVNGMVPIAESEYSVEYSDNTNAGTATVTITDKDGGAYIIFGSTTFTINKADITPVVTIDDWTYGSLASERSVTGNTGGGTVTYEFKAKGAADGTYSASVPTNAGEYTIRATIGATDNYNGAMATADFTISPKSLGDGVRTSGGVDITLVNSVLTVKDGETTLEEDTDYDVSTEDDFVIVSGKGNYTGSAKLLSANAVFFRPDGSSEYLSAYNSGVDVSPPVGVTPYIVKMVYPSIGTVILTEVDYIPEGVPVLLVANSDKSNFAASPIEDSTDPIPDAILSSNKLKVAPDVLTDPEDPASPRGVHVEDTEAYVFYRGEFVLTKEGTISPGKIFLYNPNYTPSSGGGGGPSPVRRYLRIVVEAEEDPMGIDNEQQTMVNGQLNDLWYTLDGRRLDGKPTRKGIYITNGKKHIIK